MVKCSTCPRPMTRTNTGGFTCKTCRPGNGRAIHGREVDHDETPGERYKRRLDYLRPGGLRT
jgi:hypothetical protein